MTLGPFLLAWGAVSIVAAIILCRVVAMAKRVDPPADEPETFDLAESRGEI